MLIAAAGRFRMNQLLDAVLAQPNADAELGGWGIAYCYGNRLEVIRSAERCDQDPGFRQLAELRTDMLVLVPDNRPGIPAREVQPFSRRESGHTWAFCHHGDAPRAGELDTGGRLPDSSSPSEKVLLHLLAHLDPASPDETLTAALGGMRGDNELYCCLLNADFMAMASWFGPGQEQSGLWRGSGELVVYVASQPLRSLPEISWEPFEPRSVLAIGRARRELP